MADLTYGRGQVEWALWRTFKGQSVTAPDEMPKVFATRVKKLLELDRNLDLSTMDVPPQHDFAFAPLPENGTEIAYKPVDAFCMAIALDLLDAGYKQSEIVFLMKYLRADLESRFSSINSKPSLINRQRYSATEHPGYPIIEHKGRQYADARVFLVIQKIEMKEVISGASDSKSQHPTILEPIFCHGASALAAMIADLMPDHPRAVTIIEIARNAQAIRAFLLDAPLIQRGRPKNS